jgi:predicted enzyme related to lactoylglutathione lyase
MANGFCHTELNTTDLGKAKKFYAKLFDWKLADLSMGGNTYTMVDTGKPAPGMTNGGMQKVPMAGMPSAWLTYVLVDDVKKTIAQAKKLGATIHVDGMDVGMGILGIFTDPTGASLGVWQPKPQPKAAAKKPAAKKAPAKKAPAKKPARKK